jgi:hypothetical protein
VRDIVAFDIESGGRIGERGLVVRAQLDRSAESASAGCAPAGALRRWNANCSGLLASHGRSGDRRLRRGGGSPIGSSQITSNNQNGREQCE